MARCEVTGLNYYKRDQYGSVEEVPGQIVGFDDGKWRNCRVTFRSPALGASSLSVTINAYWSQGKFERYPIRCYVSTDPEAYKGAGPGYDTYNGTVTVGPPQGSQARRTCTVSFNINLDPNKTYYMWFYTNADSYGGYAGYINWAQNYGEVIVESSGVYGVGLVYIDNGAGFQAYQCYIDNGSTWELYAPYIDNGSGWDLCT